MLSSGSSVEQSVSLSLSETTNQLILMLMEEEEVKKKNEEEEVQPWT